MSDRNSDVTEQASARGGNATASGGNASASGGNAIAMLASRRVSLDLATHDLCFVAALHLRAQQAEISAFSEEQLLDVFEQVISTLMAEPGGSRPRAAATIRKLRTQRLLLRVDAHGVSRAGEYALTRLGSSIAEFYLDDEEALTQESLAVLMRTLTVSLREVREAARSQPKERERHARIVLPLRITAADLVGGIQKRQRSFDLQQEETQREMAELIATDWFAAVERCEQLLETTSMALAELGALLLKDSHEILGTLQDIQDACLDMGYDEGAAAAGRVNDQVVKAVAWGSARQRAFGDHYEYVHRYLRDVVRIDPARTLLHRLREQLLRHAHGAAKGEGEVATMALVVAHAAPMRVLRETTSKRPKPPVVRERKEREKAPTVVATQDPEAALRERVKDALAHGSTTLSRVTAQLTGELDAATRFVEAGRVAEAVVRVHAPLARAERPWVAVPGTCELEEWDLPAASGGEPS